MELKDIKTAEECRMVLYQSVKDFILVAYKDIEEAVSNGKYSITKTYELDNDYTIRKAASFFSDKGYRVEYTRGLANRKQVYLTIDWNR